MGETTFGQAMMVRAAACALVLLALAGCNEPQGQAQSTNLPPQVPLGEGFDFYVLALSWSPGYCASEGARANRQQCASGQEFGFIAHGLWPQFERGWPEFCDTDAPLRVDRDLAATIADIMPSTGLVGHQWRKHGSCTGLNQSDYFAITRAAYERVTIPDQFHQRRDIARLDPDDVEEAFRAANRDLPADAIAVTCDRRFLRDVRICLSIDLSAFHSCPQVDRRACTLATVVVPPDS